MNSIEALTKIVDELEHRIAQLEGNKLDKVKLKAYIDSRLGIAKATGKSFIEPTVEELNEHVKSVNRQWSEGNSAENFISFYGGKGWMIGKNKMVSWKHTVCS